MDLSFLNKIPFLKNIDFSDPKVSKNFAMMALAFVAILAYGTYTCIGLFSSDEKAAAAEAEQREQERMSGRRSAMPSFPQGENNEGDYKSHMEALEDSRRSTTRARDIWAQSESLGDLKSKFDSVTTANAGGRPEPEEQPIGRRNVFPQSEPKAQAQPKRSDDSREEDAETRRNRRAREIMVQNGLDPDTGLPMAYSSSAYAAAQAAAAGQGASQQPAQSSATTQQASAEPEPQQEPEVKIQTPKVVRRTSAISTLDGSNDNTMGEISTFDDGSEYVSEADIHPIKVMFSATEKIRSGQRIYLRLLEDIIVDGMLIPKNTQLPALCNIGERISIQVNSLEMNNKIYTLNFVGYDTDGGEGLYCPQTVKNENVREGVQQAASIATSALSSYIQGMASRITNAGVGIAQRNLQNQSVTVSSGYTFFLVKKQN